MATFVLVHGSWHGGWCWQKVARLLRQSDHEVYTPTLTGLGERSHLATPQTGLELHIQDILQVIEYEDLHNVVLVGHSYAGLVITRVAECIPQLLARLIYLDAFIPHDGQNAFDLMPPGSEEQFVQLAASQGDGWLVPAMSPATMGIPNPADIAWTQSRLTPMPLLTHQQRIRMISSQAQQLPRTYILCTQFGTHAFAQEAQNLGWDYFQLETGHDAMITMPNEVAQTLTLAIANRNE
jgi:pimeloyl-ACP methyl ester carboxylesterase